MKPPGPGGGRSGRGAEGELVWTSPYPPIEAEGGSLPELVLAAAGRAGDRPALIDAASGQVVSFATLAARVDRVAAGLATMPPCCASLRATTSW